MLPLESFSVYILICVLAPLVGAFTLSFIMIFEKQLDNLHKEAIQLKLEKELQIANYHQLNQQIQPHFFFNTLNSLMSLARLNRKDELLKGLEVMAKFFKFKYINHDNLIIIDNDISYVNNYLEIQLLRFGQRLQITQHVEDDCRLALTPPFLIQTIVENAFKHGFEKNAGPSNLRINIYTDGLNIYIEVWNTHHINPFDQNQEYVPQDEGYGMLNIQKRLDLLFPDQEASITMEYIHTETLVKVNMPLTY